MQAKKKARINWKGLVVEALGCAYTVQYILSPAEEDDAVPHKPARQIEVALERLEEVISVLSRHM